MPVGWGRRAAGRLSTSDNTRALEDDALLKELNEQLNYTVDYDQWKRETEKKQKEVLGTNKNTRVPRKVPEWTPKPPAERTFFTVAHAPSFLRRTKVESEVECNHQHGRQQTPEVDVEKQMADDRTKMLKLKIHARKYSIEEYKQRYEKLLMRNMELRKIIEQDESVVASNVKSLLRRYEKFRNEQETILGGIATLNQQLYKEVSTTKRKLLETERSIQFDLLALEANVAEVDEKLKEVQQELYVLQNYKDKEYPVKAIKIAELQKEIQQLTISNADDHEELDYIITSELAKYKKQQQDVSDNITKRITEEAISQMHPTLKDMALQNMVMLKEKEVHQAQIRELENGNKELQQVIRNLLKDPKTNTRLQLFPEFFPSQEKCTPDMEVVLDIPTQEWLPI